MSRSPHDGTSAITRRDTEMTFRPSGAPAPARPWPQPWPWPSCLRNRADCFCRVSCSGVLLSESELESIWPTPGAPASDPGDNATLLATVCSPTPTSGPLAGQPAPCTENPHTQSLLPLLPAGTPRPFSRQQVEGPLPPLPELRLPLEVPQNEGVPTARGPERAVPSPQPQQDPKPGPDEHKHPPDWEDRPGGAHPGRQSRGSQADVGREAPDGSHLPAMPGKGKQRPHSQAPPPPQVSHMPGFSGAASGQRTSRHMRKPTLRAAETRHPREHGDQTRGKTAALDPGGQKASRLRDRPNKKLHLEAHKDRN